MLVRLSVFSHPRWRALQALRDARGAARQAATQPGIAFARGLQSAVFRPDTRFAFTLGRTGLMLWSETRTALDEAMSVAVAPLAGGARERWDVWLQAARVHGAWAGFAPQPNGVPPLDLDEPAVVFIHGVLRGRYLWAFLKDNAKVGQQLAATEGYLGGMGLADTPLTTASFSCWRTARDAQRFAFAAGAHRDAYKVDRAEQRHRTEFFVRFRPLASTGTVDGRDPLAAVLRETTSESP